MLLFLLLCALDWMGKSFCWSLSLSFSLSLPLSPLQWANLDFSCWWSLRAVPTKRLTAVNCGDSLALCALLHRNDTVETSETENGKSTMCALHQCPGLYSFSAAPRQSAHSTGHFLVPSPADTHRLTNKPTDRQTYRPAICLFF